MLRSHKSICLTVSLTAFLFLNNSTQPNNSTNKANYITHIIQLIQIMEKNHVYRILSHNITHISKAYSYTLLWMVWYQSDIVSRYWVDVDVRTVVRSRWFEDNIQSWHPRHLGTTVNLETNTNTLTVVLPDL